MEYNTGTVSGIIMVAVAFLAQLSPSLKPMLEGGIPNPLVGSMTMVLILGIVMIAISQLYAWVERANPNRVEKDS